MRNSVQSCWVFQTLDADKVKLVYLCFDPASIIPKIATAVRAVKPEIDRVKEDHGKVIAQG